MKVHYVNTENQAADLFATSLARSFFEKFKKKLGLTARLCQKQSRSMKDFEIC